MKFVRRPATLIGVAMSCVAIGAGVGVIANAGAATSTGGATSTASASSQGKAPQRRSVGRRLLARAVHGDLVIHTRSGFQTATYDRGIVQSVSGQQLTLKDGTKTTTYKTVTLTIPTTARVRDNRRAATLSDVKPGQRAVVIQGLRRTYVIARG